MKLKNIPTIALLLLIAAACNKRSEVDEPDDFNVTSAGTAKAGDTMYFNIEGSPDIILFYSGEPGKKYINSGRLLEAGIPKMVFQSSMQQGVLPGTDSLRLMVSTNLQGYDAASISAAGWTDITSRNKKWPATLSTGFTSSDSIDLSDFNNADKVNIAFRFIGKNTAAQQRKWQIQNLTITNKLADGTSTPLLSNFASAAWVQCSLKNDTDSWNVGTWNVSASDAVNNSSGIPIRTAYPISFDPGTGTGIPENDDWLLATAVNLKTTRPDAGTIIKARTALTLTTYKYIFKTPGDYTATFIATNAIGDVSKQVVRQLQFTIVPR
jgi:hypothetical protein